MARLFVSLVRQGLGQNITQAQEDRARPALVRFRELRTEGFRTANFFTLDNGCRSMLDVAY